MSRIKNKISKALAKLDELEISFMRRNISTEITIKGVKFDRGVFSSLRFYDLRTKKFDDVDQVISFINPVLKLAVPNRFRRFIFKLRLKKIHYVGIYLWLLSCYDFINRVESIKLRGLKVKGAPTVDYSELDELGALPFILTIAEKYSDLDSAMAMKYYEVFSIMRYLTIVNNKEVEKHNKKYDEARRGKN